MQAHGHPAWEASGIIKGLRLKGWTQARAAKELRIPYHKFNYALKSGSLECVRDFISGVLGVPPQLLWPKRFPPAWGGLEAAGRTEGADLGPGDSQVGICDSPARPGTPVEMSTG